MLTDRTPEDYEAEINRLRDELEKAKNKSALPITGTLAIGGTMRRRCRPAAAVTWTAWPRRCRRRRPDQSISKRSGRDPPVRQWDWSSPPFSAWRRWRRRQSGALRQTQARSRVRSDARARGRKKWSRCPVRALSGFGRKKAGCGNGEVIVPGVQRQRSASCQQKSGRCTIGA